MRAELKDADERKVHSYTSSIYGDCMTCVCGGDDEIELRYHPPLGEGDKHYIDVYKHGKLTMRDFCFDWIEFE